MSAPDRTSARLALADKIKQNATDSYNRAIEHTIACEQANDHEGYQRAREIERITYAHWIWAVRLHDKIESQR